ncbi:DUF6090 family protein [Flavobacteriaceae sp. LMIT009]
MIKFFRKIRQSLLSENKISKYLLYAIGEILLVVIGILIALSINNWNQERKNKEKILAIFEEIQDNMINDVETINGRLHRTFYERGYIIDVKEKRASELGNRLLWLGVDNFAIEPTTSGFNKLVANTEIIPKEYVGIADTIMSAYKLHLNWLEPQNQNSRDITQKYKYYLADNKVWFPDWAYDHDQNNSLQNDFVNDPILLNQLVLWYDVIGVISNYGRIAKESYFNSYKRLNEITAKDLVIPINKFYYKPDHKILQSYAGLYVLNEGSYTDDDVSVEFINDTLFFKGGVKIGISSIYNAKHEMIPLTDSLFYINANLPFLKFTENSKTNELQLIYENWGEKNMFKKVNN